MKDFFLMWALGMVKLTTNLMVFIGAIFLLILFIPVAIMLGLHDMGVAINEGRALRKKRREENREVRDPYEYWGDLMK